MHSQGGTGEDDVDALAGTLLKGHGASAVPDRKEGGRMYDEEVGEVGCMTTCLRR
jgi:hypothetical protein